MATSPVRRVGLLFSFCASTASAATPWLYFVFVGLGTCLPVASAQTAQPGVVAQAQPSGGSATDAQVVGQAARAGNDAWQWATQDQAQLRILALDGRRQQVVAKIGDGELFILKRGTSVPGLAVVLTAVTGKTAIFQPVSGLGKSTIDQIAITLTGQRQVTTTERFATPPRTVASGWVVSPR